MLKSLRRNIRQVLNPKKVQVVRINGKAVNETVLDNTNAYLAAYMVILVGSFLLLCLDMLVGRLEIFPILILLSRSTWNGK